MAGQDSKHFWSSVVILVIVAISILSCGIQLTRFVWNPNPHDDEMPARKWTNNETLQLNGKFEHVFWFIQVSDLHISINFDPSRGPDFERWCHEVVIDTVKPKVTLVTGDLTDARTKRLMNGEQYVEEWIMYASIINRTKVTDKTLWLDLRGNHDDFGVFDWMSDNNYYRIYSVQGRHHKRHYVYTINDGSDTYSFVGVDACLEPGPNRPFNTIGLLHKEDIDSLRDLKKKTAQDNMTIWFGHYPTRAINGPQLGLSSLINGPYLSGHVHMPNLYAYQSPGFLDIELADWRAKRKFRLAAIDHGIFSFHDAVLDKWPLIVITNPKHSNLYMPKVEPTYMIPRSTHIRALVFSKNPIKSVSYSIDSQSFIAMERVDDSPLFVAPWTPEKYQSGIHTIEVKAVDSETEQSVIQEFSLDGSKIDFSFRSKLIMTYMHQTVWGLAFILVVWSIVTPLLLFRCAVWWGRGTTLKQMVLQKNNLFMSVILKLYLLACVDKVFIPVIAVPLYVSFGPWLIGPVISGHFGISFVWGTFVDGMFLPGGVSYVMGLVFLLFVHAPFTFIISNETHLRLRSLLSPRHDQRSNSFRQTCCRVRHLATIAVFAAHLFVSLIYGDAYGVLAWSLGIAHSWTLFLAIYVWLASFRLELKDFRGFTSSKNQISRPEDATDLLGDKDRTD